jgi:small subunit ribosomal protein S3
MKRTPLGERIIISASRPGLVVGKKGQNIKELTSQLKKKFNLENPQIEINEVENINLDASIVAERIVDPLEKFGTARFKGIAHKVMQDVIDAGAMGVEIIISGKIPSSRSKSWRFYSGYLKKCGDIALTGVDKSYTKANLKTGTIGVKVRIMPPTTKLPDKIEIKSEKEEIVEEVEPEKPAKKDAKAKKKKTKKKEKTKKEDSEKKEKSEQKE